MEIYGTILLRTIILYVVIIITFRLMGKREIGELGIVDLVVFVMIAEIAAIAIENYNESFSQYLIPIFLLVILQVIFSFISLKSRKFRKLVDGEPSMIIKRGKIDEKEMKRQRYNFDDLMMQLREKDIRNIKDVEYAILEPTGKLSVFKYENETGFTIPLILEGKIQNDKLRELNLSEEWLYNELAKKNIIDINKISFCSYQNGELYIDFIDETK
ncbi:DUF421 domain-containing protein [Pallidibacillus pasinlerensis]|uniref:DUF421 domain-containing protein n=1 Tax=Pallidibacillus pasinlerensis TaxID=2703818 RepID=A0ABX0A739_9BACI|nr:DUF421 domain-containing protein [Pallidibacillus pasinlerensis]NCU18632.1 DUF421 domain-containing protein [Pallidibacillus pasinlerensis]